MTSFKLLVVEDNQQDLEVCIESIAKYQHEHKREIALVACKTVEEALSKIDNSLDGAIIDLKLDNDAGGGNEVVKKISESMYRVPVAIYTGTPAEAMPFPYLGVFTKGEDKYTDLFDKFWGIHDTGMTRILGGRGMIEETLRTVFEKNLLPTLDTWVPYGKADPNRTERALLRHTINHLMQLLDTDDDFYYPEEVYISPPLTDNLRTGTIVMSKQNKIPHVVLNPACDLAIRKSGECKTDRILIVEILDSHSTITSALNAQQSPITKSDKRREFIAKFLSNRFAEYYHWLPSTTFFNGGLVNFRRISTCSTAEIKEHYSPAGVQISPSFVKDMVSRFSAYYARQGQPDIDFGTILQSLATSTTPTETAPAKISPKETVITGAAAMADAQERAANRREPGVLRSEPPQTGPQPTKPEDPDESSKK